MSTTVRCKDCGIVRYGNLYGRAKRTKDHLCTACRKKRAQQKQAGLSFIELLIIIAIIGILWTMIVLYVDEKNHYRVTDCVRCER